MESHFLLFLNCVCGALVKCFFSWSSSMDPRPSMHLPELSPLHFSVQHCFMLHGGVSNPEFALLSILKEKSHHSTRLLPFSQPWWNRGILPHKTVLFQRCSWCAAAPLLRPQEGQYLGVKMLLSDAKHLILHLFGWFFSYLNKLEQAWQRAGRESFPGQLVSVIQ